MLEQEEHTVYYAKWNLRVHLDICHNIDLKWTGMWSLQELEDRHKNLESKNVVDHKNRGINVES